MSTQPMQRRHRGFTLIELMVAIAIAAILTMVGVPSFVSFLRNSELTSATNSLVAAIGTARGEAMKRGRAAVVVPKVDTNWSSGWLVFIDVNNDQQFTTGTDIEVTEQAALTSYFTATGTGTAGASPAYLMFDASGYAKNSSANFASSTLSIARNDLTGASRTDQTRIIIISKTGRARACRPAQDTTCTTTATE